MNARLSAIALTLTLATSAPVARAARGEISDEDRAWWAFQPVVAPAVPGDHVLRGWAKTEIDHFILTRLEENGLVPAPEAPRDVLYRRLSFDLTGLPPSAEETEAFVSDTAPGAWERAVDRLLASPHYGERWARHWLDLVRYADSDGYKADDYRPDAWRYRDYVIRSFNEDKPWTRFVEEQLAGDEIDPDNPDALIATGYLRHWIYEYNNRDAVGQWSIILNDITDTTADVFLGLGLQCARCHDHKFDPLLQKDYYRLQAFFAPLLPRDRTVVAPPDEKARTAAKRQEWESATADIRRQISELEAKYRKNAEQDAVTKFPEDIQAILTKTPADRSPHETQVAYLAFDQVRYEWDRLDGRIKGEDKAKLVELRKQLGAFDAMKPAEEPVAPTVTDTGVTAPVLTIPRREAEGNVLPGIPVILDPEPMAVTPLAHSTGRRTALARWITSPQNPLTARVLVNRIWQQHFGRGLSGTPSDFGRLGERPSHPELLDWLADRFVREGWSLKKLHRLILTSAVWKQGSASSAEEHARQLDPQNRLLWRWNTRRLDAEQIRDALFSATGELDLSAGGPGVDASKPRRAIYTRVLRNVRDPLTDVFDTPQQFNSTPTRDSTTTPVQSLMLANSPFLLERAAAMAADLCGKSADDSAVTDAAWLRATGHLPRTEEREDALGFLREQRARAEAERAGKTPGFVSEPMPQRDGRAAVLRPGSSQEILLTPAGGPGVPAGDFAVEAVVLVRSVYNSGDVRVLAGQWSGRAEDRGWSLGVTGQKSRSKPQSLVLQLSGQDAAGAAVYEPVFSGLTLQTDRSYYVAASVRAGGEGGPLVTFYLKDLANEDEPLRTAQVPQPVVSGWESSGLPLVLGGRNADAGSRWDGLLDEFRLSRGVLTEEILAFRQPAVRPETLACWLFENAAGFATETVSGTARLSTPAPPGPGPRESAVADLCQALLTSSAALYLE